MSEFSSRVEAQRQVLKVVNSLIACNEQLSALSSHAITRWHTVNNLGQDARIVKLLNSIADEIFIMANNSEDAISSAYRLSAQRLNEMVLNLRLEAEQAAA